MEGGRGDWVCAEPVWMESSKNGSYVQMDMCMFVFVRTFEWIVMQVLFIKYAEMVNILSWLGN
jgi:hypothetical protein